jgi:xylulokinase
MEKILTVDIGTSAIKVILFNAAGEMLHKESATYKNVKYKGQSAEQDANEWWKLTRKMIRKVTSALGSERKLIRAIAVTGQMHGAVHIGGDKVLAPVINYQDRRSVNEYLKLLDYSELFYDKTGAFIDANMVPAKMLYISHHNPSLLHDSELLLAPKDYIRWELTGEAATDPTDAAGFLLYDLNNGKWDEELCNLSNININKLPEIRPTISQAAKIKRELASDLGLPDDVVIAIGGGDDIESLGSGTDVGDFYEHMGTSGSICVISDKRIYDSIRRIETFPDVFPDRFLVGGSTSSAGAADRWFRENICFMSGNIEEKFQKMVKTKQPSEITFLPYLSGARCPIWEPQRTGAFVGLTLAHTSEDLFQSVAEGVAFSLRDIIECLDLLGFGINGSVYSSGGFGTVPSYGQLRADIYHRSVKRIIQEEATGFAAMLIAGKTCGLIDDILKTARNLSKIAWTAESRIEVSKEYDMVYKRYCNIQKRLANI